MHGDQAKPSHDVLVLPAIRTAMQMSRLASSLPASSKSSLTVQSFSGLRTKYHRQRTELTIPVSLTPDASSGSKMSNALKYDSSKAQDTCKQGQGISVSGHKTWKTELPLSTIKQYNDALESFSSLENTPKRRKTKSIPTPISVTPEHIQTSTPTFTEGNTVVVTPVPRVFTVDSDDLQGDDYDVQEVLMYLRKKRSQKTLAPVTGPKIGNTGKYSVKISYYEETAEVLGNTRNQARRRSGRIVLPSRLFRH